MDTKRIAESLGALMLLDFDSAHAFEEAIENLKENDLKERFTVFRKDHQEHVYHLSKIIIGLGEEPPPHSTDFRVFSTRSLASPAAAADAEEILSLLQRNEQIMNDRYAGALSLDIPDPVQSLLSRYYADEKKHLAYIASVLSLTPALK